MRGALRRVVEDVFEPLALFGLELREGQLAAGPVGSQNSSAAAIEVLE
jgi:hypothetical protein